MPMQEPASVQAPALQRFIASLFRHHGVPEDDAALVSRTLVRADLWGHQSHGILRVPWYLQRLRAGSAVAGTRPETVVDAGAIAVMDAGNALGQVAAAHAMEEAISKARQHGVGVVSVRRSNHFGTCMYFSRLAAEAGCIGFVSTNGGPAMPPWGGVDKLVGTNPWSIACPAGRHAPMILDIANTSVARGKIFLARNRGEAIPPGWAAAADGTATTDPAEAIAGFILPMAGHKGYAIGVMIDMISGVLSGSRFLDGVHSPYQTEVESGCGHLLIALDIARFRPLDDFNDDAETYIARLKASRLAAGVAEIHYPGELEARSETKLAVEGLLFPQDTIKAVQAEAALLGMDWQAGVRGTGASE